MFYYSKSCKSFRFRPSSENALITEPSQQQSDVNKPSSPDSCREFQNRFRYTLNVLSNLYIPHRTVSYITYPGAFWRNRSRKSWGVLPGLAGGSRAWGHGKRWPVNGDSRRRAWSRRRRRRQCWYRSGRSFAGMWTVRRRRRTRRPCTDNGCRAQCTVCHITQSTTRLISVTAPHACYLHSDSDVTRWRLAWYRQAEYRSVKLLDVKSG